MLLGCRTAGILSSRWIHWPKWLQYIGPQNNNKPYLKDLLRKSESLTVILLVGQGSAESNKAISYPKQESKIRLKISIYSLKGSEQLWKGMIIPKQYFSSCVDFFFEFSIKDFFFSCKIEQLFVRGRGWRGEMERTLSISFTILRTPYFQRSVENGEKWFSHGEKEGRG